MAYGIIMSIVLVGAVGCIIGFFLSFASEKFKVKVDEREVAVLSVLPGNNCGGCGYPGCAGLAEAIAKGEFFSYWICCDTCSGSNGSRDGCEVVWERI